MAEQIKISIIVPFYNSSGQIGSCIESILKQSFRNFELLLINDGSSDNSLEICKLYAKKDNRIKLYNQENKGAASARNLGIIKAEGEFIKFVDSDDEIPSDCLEKLISKGPADIIISGFVTKWKNQTIDNIPKYNVFHGNSEIIHFVSNLNIISCGAVWNKLYKRSIIIQNQIQFPLTTEDTGEDLLFNWHYYSCCNSLISIPEIVYFYKENPNSLTHYKNETNLKFIKRHLQLMSCLITISQYISKKYKIHSILKNYHNYFIDMILRRLYLSSSIVKKERLDMLCDFKSKLKDMTYNPIKESNGVVNKILTVFCYIPSVRISDLLISFVFSFKKNS